MLALGLVVAVDRDGDHGARDGPRREEERRELDQMGLVTNQYLSSGSEAKVRALMTPARAR